MRKRRAEGRSSCLSSEPVFAANGCDLTNMMAPVHEMKASPLRDTERPEDEVGEAGSGAEEAFGLG